MFAGMSALTLPVAQARAPSSSCWKTSLCQTSSLWPIEVKKTRPFWCIRAQVVKVLLVEVLHAFGILHENDVQVRCEVLERVPFLVHFEVFQVLGTRELRIHDAHQCILLPAVAYELATDHADIGIAVFRCL